MPASPPPVLPKGIDFLVIGAPRAGTTALYNSLGLHPELFLPAAKEVQFFSDPSRYAKGLDWYLSNHFSEAPASALRGEASPQYLCVDGVARRIFEAYPEVKLIATFRDPVARAYSHWRMASNRGRTDLDFDSMIAAKLGSAATPTGLTDLHTELVTWGEYGQLLSAYLEIFPRENLALLLFDDFVAEPESTLRELFEFLGVSRELAIEHLGQRRNAAGEVRSQGLDRTARRLAHLDWFKRPLKAIFGGARLARAYRWLLTEANIKKVSGAGPSPESERLLRAHYRDDTRLLESISGLSVPWAERE